jgi:uncharacterized protein YheU (UPF0270 family)
LAAFVAVPVAAISPDTLERLLEEFATRDGTDYGARETALEARVGQLRRRLNSGEAQLIYDGDSEVWDIVASDRAEELLAEAGHG